MNRSGTNKSRPTHQFDKANVISKFFYWWLWDIFKIGLSRQVTESDLYACVKSQKSEVISKRFQLLWDHELTKAKPSLFKVILKVYGYNVILVGVLFSVIELPCKLASPLLMGYLIAYFMDNPYNHSEQDAYLFATGLALSLIIIVLVFHPAQLYYFQSSLKLRVASCCLIYNKILSLTKFKMSDGLAGQAINLMSNDVSRFDYMVCFIGNLWNAPLGAIIAGYFIFDQIGIAGLVGIAILIFSMPAQVWLGKKSAQVRMETALRTDKRVKFMFSIINGIQIIKMYAWEYSFGRIIKSIREKEIKAIGKSFNIKAALLSFSVSTEIAIFLSLITYVYMGNNITAQKAFVTIAYFNYINNSLVEYWPMAITCVAEGLVSIKRVEKFLLHKVNQADETSNVKIPNKMSLSNGIIFKNATAVWDQDGSSNTGISSVNVNIGSEQLTAVIGQVGSGKTTFLEVILKELPLKEGEIEINGSVSYAAQQSWIFEGSVKNNIIFTNDYDPERYKAVVHACALERDFELLPHGDETLVGDRGVSLSGGQKARVNLARAIYRTADIYLLDDPLSAVDAHVGKHIFEKGIKEFLKDKICVLVTHQLQYLQEVKHIIVINAGRVQIQGSYDFIKESDSEFGNLLSKENFESKDDEEDDSTSKDEDKEKEVTKENEQEAVKETQQIGKVSNTIYKKYFMAVNSLPFVAVVIFLLLTAQVLQSGVSFFVSIWVSWEENHGQVANINLAGSSNFMDPNWWTTDRHVYAYATGIVALTFFVICRSFAFYRMSLRIASNLHEKLFNGVTRATMYFFNNSSTGRILNRFSKDMGAIDSMLPVVVIDCLKFFLELTGIVTIVAIINFWLLIPTFIMFLLFVGLRSLFLKTARDVKRIEAITRSPMFTHTTATLEGLTTIRAFKAQSELIHEYDQHQNLNSSAWFLFVCTSRGFAFYVDFISSLYITSIIYSFLVLGSNTLGANVGLAITQSINLIGMCNWGLRQTAELENQMTSVERVFEYTKLPSERLLETKPEVLESLPKMWSSKGIIRFKNVSLKYSENGDFVLRNLSFLIHEKEKIGIVGRTGAGKSSITQALFELAIIEGSIEIDDVDISTLGLHTFREKMSIIPQDPILFVGSLRDNLDPLGQKSDDEIWQSLEQVELKDPIKLLSNGLNTKVSDGGSNFSSGQRQLVCLARAILKNNKILILDEATANIDNETDNLIQKTIRKRFADCTILTVAHRIHTVMDNDRIMVLDAGEIVEFDSPQTLLQNSHGYFAKLVADAGLIINDIKHKEL